MKQSNIILISIIVLVVFGGGILLMKGSQAPSSEAVTQESPTPQVLQSTGAVTEQSTSEAPGSSVVPISETTEATKTFTITGNNYSYDVKEMKVKNGDTVKVIFKNADGFHDWNLDEFNAHTKKIQAGAEETVTFTADKTGTFEYYCSVGNHRAMGMVGKLIVQ
jgi:plastocyanin